MNKFIRTDDGLINVRLVTRVQDFVRVTPTKNNQREWRTRLHLGEDFTTYTDDDVEEITADVIPATPGYFVVGVFCDEPYEVYLNPVIGWRVQHRMTTPICVDDLNSCESHAVLDPSGMVTIPCHATYESVEKFRAMRIEELRKKQVHQDPATSTGIPFASYIAQGWTLEQMKTAGVIQTDGKPASP